jgi:hypothetical protein
MIAKVVPRKLLLKVLARARERGYDELTSSDPWDFHEPILDYRFAIRACKTTDRGI